MVGLVFVLSFFFLFASLISQLLTVDFRLDLSREY